MLGWYDERHLLAPTDQGFGIVNFKGKVVETLIKVGKNDHFHPRLEARARN
ncbi:hypothetical protein [Nonomuraea sp. SYSU D8015]|uniref:hypothetical protein n=1 Tax=Nonomuraea sp. SYSU D8015 TaxID=2593644 RepID=UPI00166011E8|nr:hypothetical protein [Nonomuraea sp. SYSU D8015]